MFIITCFYLIVSASRVPPRPAGDSEAQRLGGLDGSILASISSVVLRLAWEALGSLWDALGVVLGPLGVPLGSS